MAALTTEKKYQAAPVKNIQQPGSGAGKSLPAVPVHQRKTDAEELPVQQKKNQTGMPDQLKTGVEQLSGIDMSDVKVHYNSSQPAQLNALAYAQGTDIHVAPGQEQHLPHEAWHVAQQKQGRVQPTVQMNGGVAVNDDPSLEREADSMGAKAVQMKQEEPSANHRIIQSKNTTTAQLTYDKGKEGKLIRTLTDLNAKLALLTPAIANLTVADFDVEGATEAIINGVIAANTGKLYNGIDKGTVISFFTEELRVAVAAATAEPEVTYTYDTHGDKHFPGGAEGTKFTKDKTVVNPILEGYIRPEINRIKADAAGANRTYYYTLTRNATICPKGHNITIQVDYTHSTRTITYHGYPDNNVTVFRLSRTKGGTAIA